MDLNWKYMLRNTIILTRSGPLPCEVALVKHWNLLFSLHQHSLLSFTVHSLIYQLLLRLANDPRNRLVFLYKLEHERIVHTVVTL